MSGLDQQKVRCMLGYIKWLAAVLLKAAQYHIISPF